MPGRTPVYTAPVPSSRRIAAMGPATIAGAGAMILAAGLCAGDARAADDMLIEVHYKPVPNVQMAIWLEDRAGKFVQDVLVTQACG